MKKLIPFLLALFPFAALALGPATITMTNYHGDALAPASAEVFYRGDAVAFTNCVVYSGVAGSSVQDLSGLTVTLAWSDTTLAASTSTCAVTVATNGTWGTAITLQANIGPQVYLQLHLADTNGNSFTYPLKTIETRSKL